MIIKSPAILLPGIFIWYNVEMLYNYYFDVAALIANIFLIAIYIMRRTLRTKSNKLLFVLLVVSMFASICDIVSCYCISYPDRFPSVINYLFCYGYLFFYNAMGTLFLAYIDSKAKLAKVRKPMNTYIHAIIIFQFLLIFTSGFTHFISYFDSDNVYKHGPLMVLLYVLAAFHLLVATVLFVIERRKFNRYQVMAIVSFIVAVFLGVLIQAINPALLVGQFGNTLVLFFIYTSLENPVYHTYRATTCFNRHGFSEILKMKLREKADMSVFAFSIKDFDNLQGNFSLKDIGRLSSTVAEFINANYHENAFCIADDKFIIFFKADYEAALIRDKIEMFFSKPIALIDSDVKVSINTVSVFHIDTKLKADLIINGITYALDHNLGDDKKFDFTEITNRIKRRRDVSKAVKRAIENDLFDVYYQPIRNVESGKFQSCEALIRLNDNELGFISPEEFIPVSESEGLIVTIGEIVFEKVCKFIKDSKLISELGVRYVEINLSPIQLEEPDIIRRFRNIMDKYDVVPFWINLEITETANLSQENRMIKNIEGFHHMGMSFSLDDYGSGFASADYLFRLPVEIVKIDKSILWTAMKDVNASIVLMGTLSLMKSLGKEIVVEGVEDEEMVKILVDNGVDYLQGYYYSKPLPANKYIQFLRENNL